MLRCLTLLALAIVMSACAKPPYQEMDAAEYMVDRAREKQALEFAPSEFQAAHTALADARRAMQLTDYGNARESLEFALRHARRAVVLAEEGQARRAEEAARRTSEKEQARQLILQSQAKEATQQVPPPTPPPKPAPKPAPKIVPVTSYTVGEGEDLWSISAQPQVYNDGLLWPLLYRANRDQIKDPRQIFPGQVLGIRRDMTADDLEDARRRARESDIFPITPPPPAKQ